MRGGPFDPPFIPGNNAGSQRAAIQASVPRTIVQSDPNDPYQMEGRQAVVPWAPVAAGQPVGVRTPDTYYMTVRNPSPDWGPMQLGRPIQGQPVDGSFGPAGPAPQLQRETADALLSYGSSPGSSAAPASGLGQQPGGQGNGFKLGFGPEGSRLTNQDFNPAGYRPNESRSTAIGKYGGAPLYAATLGAPFSVLDDRINAIAKREHELDKAIKDFDPTKDLADPKAVKYKDTLNEWGMGQIERYVSNITDAYGEEKGMQRLMTGGTKEAMGLRRLTRHLNTVIANVDDAVAKSQAIVVGMDDGTLQYNERLYKMAEDVEKRLGEYEQNNDPEELAALLPRFNANVSLVDQLNKDNIPEMIAKAGSTQKIFELVKSGDPLYSSLFSTLLSKKTIDRGAIVDALTERYAPQYKRDMSKEEVRQMIDAMAPELYEEDVERTQKPVASSSGSSKGGGSNAPVGASLGDPTVVPENTTRLLSGKPIEAVMTKGMYRPTVDLMSIVSDQGALSRTHVFRDGGKEVAMHALRIMNVDGELFIIGKKTGLPKTTDAAGSSTMMLYPAMSPQGPGQQATPEEEAAYKEFLDLPSIAVPFAENERLLGKIYNVDTESLKRELGYLGPNTEEGPNTPVQSSGQSQAAILQRLGVSQAVWDRLSEAERSAIMKKEAAKSVRGKEQKGTK